MLRVRVDQLSTQCDDNNIPKTTETTETTTKTTTPNSELLTELHAPTAHFSFGGNSSQETVISELTGASPVPTKHNKPATTARNEAKQNKIKKGIRVRTTRSKLYQVLKTDKQRQLIPIDELPNSAFF